MRRLAYSSKGGRNRDVFRDLAREVRADLVAVAVFKTVVRNDISFAGGFDSHALPLSIVVMHLNYQSRCTKRVVVA